MNFVVVTNEWLSEHGILPLPTMRMSKDGSKVLMHEDYLSPYIQTSTTVEETEEGTIVKPMDVATYPSNSKELKELLESEDWSYAEGEIPAYTNDFIQVAAIRNLMATTQAHIQTFQFTNTETNQLADMLPDWNGLIGETLEPGFKLLYNGKPYRVIQGHTAQANWDPESSKSLFNLISNHNGTMQDPIPYEHWMVLDPGLYYMENGIMYRCVTGSTVGYDSDMSALGALVQKVEQEFNL